MKHINVLAVLAFLPVAVLAANNFDDEVNAELDRMYDASGKTGGSSSSSTQRATTLPSAVQVNVTNASSQGQTQASDTAQSVAQANTQAQKQPTTVIEASPLTESRADRIRKARQEVEVQTEQKIVEKLELSRIEDERRRSEILFGDKFNQLSGAQQAPVVAVATPTPAPVMVAPVVVAAPAPVQEVAPVVVAPAVKEDRLSKEDVRSEMSAALADFHKEANKEKPQDKWTMGALLGVGEYPDAVNVKGSYAVGFSAGKKFQDRMLVEGSFMYSTYEVEQVYGGGVYQGQFYPRITSMDQYGAGLTAKYQLWQAALRPVIGATLAYTYRSFTDTQFSSYSSDATSHALDVGGVIGADLEVSETFSLGLDMRYMMNLTSKTSSNFQQSIIYQNKNTTPIEKFNYYTLGLVGRTTF